MSPDAPPARWQGGTTCDGAPARVHATASGVRVGKPREWARWRPGRWWTVGLEEELMLLDPSSWRLAQASEHVLASLPVELAARASMETHAGALELSTGVHDRAAGAVAELAGLRRRLAEFLGALGLRVGAAGMHPFAQWQDTRIASGVRPGLVHESMRELARREPTFALHVHVGVGDPEVAIRIADRLSAHVPLLLALSANSPFWQGRDSGLASARTPLFGMFPRTGIPPRFGSYDAWVDAVTTMIDSGAISEPTFLWWDVRPQPRFGTVEVRVMDAQTTLSDVAGLTALILCLARLEGEGFTPEAVLDAPAVLAENRFLAARDGLHADLIDPCRRRRVPVRRLLNEVLIAATPYARQLGCADELELVEGLAQRAPADRQRFLARAPGGLATVVPALSDAFTSITRAARIVSPARQAWAAGGAEGSPRLATSTAAR